jgi:hypothetical protein
MSVRAFTNSAAALLAKIRKLIDQGHIDTWEYDHEGDFTHTPSQWEGLAWLRPQPQSDKLRLVIVKTEDIPRTREVFAIYNGRFIEMLIAHVPDKFTSACASANPADDEPALQE